LIPSRRHEVGRENFRGVGEKSKSEEIKHGVRKGEEGTTGFYWLEAMLKERMESWSSTSRQEEIPGSREMAVANWRGKG